MPCRKRRLRTYVLRQLTRLNIAGVAFAVAADPASGNARAAMEEKTFELEATVAHQFDSASRSGVTRDLYRHQSSPPRGAEQSPIGMTGTPLNRGDFGDPNTPHSIIGAPDHPSRGARSDFIVTVAQRPRSRHGSELGRSSAPGYTGGTSWAQKRSPCVSPTFFCRLSPLHSRSP